MKLKEAKAGMIGAIPEYQNSDQYLIVIVVKHHDDDLDFQNAIKAFDPKNETICVVIEGPSSKSSPSPRYFPGELLVFDNDEPFFKMEMTLN